MLLTILIINIILLSTLVVFILYMVYIRPYRLEDVWKTLVAKEQNIRHIMDAISEAIIVVDSNNTIIDCNKTSNAMFHCNRGSLVGVRLYEIMSDTENIIKKLSGSDYIEIINKTVDMEAMCLDGSTLPVSVSFSRLVDKNKIQFVFVIRDIRHRKRNEEQVHVLNSALETRLLAAEAFNRSICHDLNAPLRTIDGFTEILEQDYSNNLDTNGKDYIKRVRYAVKKMCQLIKDMMKLAIVTQPDTQLDLREMSLTNQFRTIASDYAMAYPERKVNVTVADNMRVYADLDLLAIVVENLISNAWKFTSKNKEANIEIGYNVVNGQPVYHIKDNGVGFDQSKVDKLFKPFSRLHAQSEFEGSGIGLSIIKRVIDLHKGKVWAEGAVDKGATFYFTLGTTNA